MSAPAMTTVDGDAMIPVNVGQMINTRRTISGVVEVTDTLINHEDVKDWVSGRRIVTIGNTTTAVII